MLRGTGLDKELHMIAIDFLLALMLAVFMSIIFFVGFRRRRSKMGFIASFVLLFLLTWAGGIWLTPIGPPLWGEVYWLGFLGVSIVFALVLSAITPHHDEVAGADRDAAQEGLQAAALLGLFYWLLLLVLAAVILLHYVLPPLTDIMTRTP